MTEDPTSTRVSMDLLLALEFARTRLAIAIAAESKSTPPERWQYYLDTADRMSRCLRKLRKNGMKMAISNKEEFRALEALRRIPIANNAQRFCQVLGDIASALE